MTRMRQISVAVVATCAAIGASVAAAQSVDLNSTLMTPLRPFVVQAPQGSGCDAGTSGIIIHDDGEAENGYGWQATVTDGRFMELFTPPAYPANFSSVCFAWITNAGIPSIDFDIVVYADDASGGPGTELGRLAVTGTVTSIGGVPFTPTFQSFDISAMNLSIASGNVFIGAEWHPDVEGGGLFIGADQSLTTPINGGYSWSNAGPWQPTETGQPSYRALTIRAVAGTAGPGAPSVSKAFAPAQILADETSTLTITLSNVSQPTDPAVLTAALVDTFPAGLVVADPPNAATTCTGGTVTAMPDDTSVTLPAGASIPAAGTCTVTVDVTAAADGDYVNTIPADGLQTDLGNNAGPANATLKVGFTFPEPYCPVTFPSNVEPITLVDFDGINNVTDPLLNGTPALEDFTSIIGNVMPGDTLPMAVEGNTDGNFTTVVTTFIDWNQDFDFDDAGETYAIGEITNSDGTDGIQAVGDIAVPVDALTGQTRMRVTKRWDVAATPCNAAGYGQAEDYTITVGGGNDLIFADGFELATP